MSDNLSIARVLAILALCSLATASLEAQTSAKPAAKASSANETGWQFRPTFLTDAEFDDNVFLLPDAKKGKLVAGAPAGTHYADMVSASDVRAQLSHPIIDCDGHIREFMPGVGRKAGIVDA